MFGEAFLRGYGVSFCESRVQPLPFFLARILQVFYPPWNSTLPFVHVAPARDNGGTQTSHFGPIRIALPPSDSAWLSRMLPTSTVPPCPMTSQTLVIAFPDIHNSSPPVSISTIPTPPSVGGSVQSCDLWFEFSVWSEVRGGSPLNCTPFYFFS